LHILHYEVGTVKTVCHNAANKCCCQDYSVWAFFCKEIFQELPMEFAVEAQRLIELKLEGSVG